jgi:transposase InsO family protein
VDPCPPGCGRPERAGAPHDRGSQYTSIRFSERLAEAGIAGSVGSKGDSYDNALAETTNGLYKSELIKKQAPWRTLRPWLCATTPHPGQPIGPGGDSTVTVGDPSSPPATARTWYPSNPTRRSHLRQYESGAPRQSARQHPVGSVNVEALRDGEFGRYRS